VRTVAGETPSRTAIWAVSSPLNQEPQAMALTDGQVRGQPVHAILLAGRRLPAALGTSTPTSPR
jgi:hypothetical protein